jgi:pantetheine-phosphate adenylyltransferase
LFTADERLAMLEETCGPVAKEAKCELSCITFSDLVIEAAKRLKAGLLIRGLRDGTDLDYEMQMAGMNEVMAPEVLTVFVPASPIVRPITATLVRQIAGMGGDVSAFVPKPVAARLKQKFAGRAGA